MDFLSRHGLIPSYSFPVHSLSLEVIAETKKENYGFKDSDIVLTRDASLGISEYAPGAEVVANGRIWTSRGLTRAPRQFMPKEWYIACPACHHVDVDVSRDGLPVACSNCGSREKRFSRQFVSPHGFVTSYEERIGKDPGQARRRERPADEARLLTIPRDEEFHASDHNLIRTTLLRAQADKDEMSGRLFVVNRGPKGSGYWICPLCHASEPAGNSTPSKWMHKNPLNGETCLCTKPGLPNDLVHQFETDVLILRIGRPIPQAEKDMEDPSTFSDCFARTLAEACRYAAANQLEIQAHELRATYKKRGAALDVILFDSISGGAGYCAELAGIPVTALLNRAARKLDCPNSCETACTACLCDYSNQNSWDQFLRKPVLRWLQELLTVAERTPLAEIGAIPWPTPSLLRLTEELADSSEVHLFAPILDNEATEVTPDGGTLGWALGQLMAGKHLHVHIGQDLCGKIANAGSVRAALRHFSPWLEDGRLRIGYVKPNPTCYSKTPRIFSPVGTHKAWYTLDPLAPLLDTLLPEPIFRSQSQATQEQSSMMATTRWYSAADLRPALPLERFPFRAGEQRDLKRVFRILAEQHVERLIIHDPFCESHIDKLFSFLQSVKGIVKSIDRIEVRCRELSTEDRRYQLPAVVKARLETAIAKFATRNVEVAIAPQFQKRQFHDRWVQFKFIDCASGVSHTHRFDLTGGIDYLMDPSATTTVYRYEIDS